MRCLPLWFSPALASSTSTLLLLLLIYLQPRCRLYPYGPEPSVIQLQSRVVLDYQYYAQCDGGCVGPGAPMDSGLQMMRAYLVLDDR